jgi:hypothetical protein
MHERRHRAILYTRIQSLLFFELMPSHSYSSKMSNKCNPIESKDKEDFRGYRWIDYL